MFNNRPWKKAVLFALLFVSLSLPAHAEEKTITVSSLPTSPDEFTNLRDQIAKTPEGGAAMLWMALATYGKNPNLGLQFLTIALDRSNIEKGSVYKGYAPARSIMYHINRLGRRDPHPLTYFPFAYVKGGTPQNNYNVSAPYDLTFSRNKYSGSDSSGNVKVFIKVYGVSPRPIRMKRNKSGIWKAKELSSMFLDVQAPESTQPVDEL